VKKLNEVLKRRVAELGGNQAEIARSINFSSQRFGKYLRGTKIPVELLDAWKLKYNEDLQAISETETEKIISRETRSEDKVKLIPRDVWEELQDNNAVFKGEIDRLWALVNRLTAEPVRANKG
jgi:hypothetical protein